MNFELKQNSTLWHVAVDNLIEKGEALELLKSDSTLAWLEEYMIKIQTWQSDAALLLTETFREPQVANTYCPPIEQFDLRGVSHFEAVKILKKGITDRVFSLKELQARTK